MDGHEQWWWDARPPWCRGGRHGGDRVRPDHLNDDTLTDSTGGSKTTLSSWGSYEVFMAAFDAADGTGKWAMDGGSQRRSRLFLCIRERFQHRRHLRWRCVVRHPPILPVGRCEAQERDVPVQAICRYPRVRRHPQKAFVAKIKTTISLPTCVDSCSAGTSVVKAGHCYIDRHCYAAGDFSPYPGADCMYRGATTEASSGPDTTSQTTWSGPDTTSHCLSASVRARTSKW